MLTNKIKKISTAILALFVMFSPVVASAETVVRTGNSVTIGVNQTVENNLYAAAGNISLSGEVKEDMYAVAGSVTINGPIGTDLTVFGGNIQTHAKVGDDARFIGGDVVVADEIGGDLFVIAGHLKLLSSASVKGNIYFYGGEAEVFGKVDGALIGSADTFVINGEIGSSEISARKITLGDTAVVKGDLLYKSNSDPERAVGAVIEGSVTKVGGLSTENSSSMPMLFLLSWFFASFCVLLLFRGLLDKLLLDIKNNPSRTGAVGLIAFIVLPAISVMLIATTLGAWIGVAALLTFLLAMLITLVFVPLLLGGYVMGIYKKTYKVDIWSAVLGMAIVFLLALVPFIGGLLLMVVFLLVFGAIIYSVYKLARTK